MRNGPGDRCLLMSRLCAYIRGILAYWSGLLMQQRVHTDLDVLLCHAVYYRELQIKT